MLYILAKAEGRGGVRWEGPLTVVRADAIMFPRKYVFASCFQIPAVGVDKRLTRFLLSQVVSAASFVLQTRQQAVLRALPTHGYSELKTCLGA